MHLPDINVWLALTFDSHVHHPAAKTWFDNLPDDDTFLSDPRVAFADEPANLETHWRAFTQSQSRSPQVWNDAYLAAFALAANLQLVSFDKSLTQYPNVTCTVLP